MLKQNHPFHLVDVSPWPFISSFAMMFLTLGLTEWFQQSINILYILGYMTLMLTIFQWWRDVIRESTFQGNHSFKVTLNMRWGMILFITSEVLFFLSFFWAFFHSSLSPNIELGLMWPPLSIHPFNPMQIPLLNTLILLSSGASITWAHHNMLENNFEQTTLSVHYTIILGLYFSLLQGYEYLEASFAISDSSYGSTFFMATGFHGIHVIIGSSFIMYMYMRQTNFHLSPTHHFGFEAAAWYWHFVDVVWLFLYTTIYWWGN